MVYVPDIESTTTYSDQVHVYLDRRLNVNMSANLEYKHELILSRQSLPNVSSIWICVMIF